MDLIYIHLEMLCENGKSFYCPTKINQPQKTSLDRGWGGGENVREF